MFPEIVTVQFVGAGVVVHDAGTPAPLQPVNEAPAIGEAQRAGMAVDGPYGADTLLQRAGYDAYVVMLHDQGHVAAKLLAPKRVAALTIGTPVLFSSVGHGSALDIAGQGKADASAMREAITRLAARRRRAPAT